MQASTRRDIDPAQEELQARIDHYRATQWIENNPDGWRYMLDLATREAKAKRHFTMQWLIEQTRNKYFVDRGGDSFKVNNTFAPVFARKMIEQKPELRPYVSTRKSRFDKLSGC